MWWLKLHVREVAEKRRVSSGGGRRRTDELRPVRVKHGVREMCFFRGERWSAVEGERRIGNIKKNYVLSNMGNTIRCHLCVRFFVSSYHS